MAQREPVYQAVLLATRTVVAAQGLRIDYRGEHNIPAHGGIVVAVNHTSYVDFLEAGLVVRRSGRWPRYMMKAELRDNRFVGFLMKHCRAIGVDRDHGAQSYHEAVAALRSGEAVIVYPEAAISRSFELKEFKSGAARMALEAGVPLVPVAIWGAQRIWSKGTPRKVGRHHFPVAVVVGEPLVPEPADDADVLTTRLRNALQRALTAAQRGFPAPAGQPWVPSRLGGSAPTPERARAVDDDERRRRRQARQSPEL